MSAAHLPSPSSATSPATATPDVCVSVLIKALNEEGKIARAIQSALRAIEATGVAGEVIVGDSLSCDRTVDIAEAFPVTVVQLLHAHDRGCGAGVQLCYRFSSGDLIYVLDGDMVLHPEFLKHGIDFLARHPDVAGVGGLIIDEVCRNQFDAIRIKNKSVTSTGEVSHLGGGGLYRKSAIRRCGGYVSDRNLKSFEEAELGARLRSAGYRLVRLPVEAVRHNGHNMSTVQLLLSHWRSRRPMAGGVLLRSARSLKIRSEFARILAHPLATAAAWIVAVPTIAVADSRSRPTIIAAFALSFMLIGLILAWRKRSISHALTSIAVWHVMALATLIGLTMKRVDPRTPVEARVLRRETLSCSKSPA